MSEYFFLKSQSLGITSVSIELKCIDRIKSSCFILYQTNTI